MGFQIAFSYLSAMSRLYDNLKPGCNMLYSAFPPFPPNMCFQSSLVLFYFCRKSGVCHRETGWKWLETNAVCFHESQHIFMLVMGYQTAFWCALLMTYIIESAIHMSAGKRGRGERKERTLEKRRNDNEGEGIWDFPMFFSLPHWKVKYPSSFVLSLLSLLPSAPCGSVFGSSACM